MSIVGLKMRLNGRKLFLIGDTYNTYKQKERDESELGCKRK